MATPSDPSLSEALSRFATALKSSKKVVEGHQELSRFVAWCGRDRKVSELSPAEIADYAQYAGLGSADSTKRFAPVKGFLTFLKEEGWSSTALAVHLRVPRGRRISGPGITRWPADNAQLSQEAYDKLVAELDSLKEERVNVVDDIRRAMADKDFRENAPLDAAKERQGFIESKIRELETDLAGAQILGSARVEQQRRICLGTKVTLREVASGNLVVYTLVDVREADVSSGKISTASPVGQALLDRTAGDEVVINVPKGTLRYLVERIGS